MSPDPRDFLPQPPWNGLPIPRILSHKRGNPFWHPRFRQVGPTKESPSEVWAIWDKAFEAASLRYPIGHPVLVAEAKRAGLSQEEMQMLIAHDQYSQELNKLREKWREEYRREEPPEEKEVEGED